MEAFGRSSLRLMMRGGMALRVGVVPAAVAAEAGRSQAEHGCGAEEEGERETGNYGRNLNRSASEARLDPQPGERQHQRCEREGTQPVPGEIARSQSPALAGHPRS